MILIELDCLNIHNFDEKLGETRVFYVSPPTGLSLRDDQLALPLDPRGFSLFSYFSLSSFHV